MNDEILIISPGDEKSERLAKAMSSRTANSILQAIAASQKTASQISDEIGIPISTLSYHLDNLTDAGIVEIVDTKYSRKGREVKIYGLKQQVVIIAPSEKPAADIRAMLLKYASLFVLVVFAALLLPVFAQYAAVPGTDLLAASDHTATTGAGLFENGDTATASVQATSVYTKGEVEAAAIAPEAAMMRDDGSATYGDVWVSEVPLLNELVLGFFGGGVCVIIFLIVYDLLAMRRNRL